MGIYVWGTGCGAAELVEQGLAPDRVAAFVDSTPQTTLFLGRPVLRPEDLPVDLVELLIVASRHSQDILQKCLELGIGRDRLLFLKNNQVLEDLNQSYARAASFLGEALLARLQCRSHIIRPPMGCPDGVLEQKDEENDYVRVKTLELLCRRLDGVPGAAAELGVYRGGFARCINLLLPDRTLYLFDSFQGFEPAEASRERQAGTCGDAFVQAHGNTAMEQVLKWMPHPEQVVLKPGFFPESLDGLETQFALVSLDADFEDSTYAGLTYFWPRLNPGGYLLLHDYLSPSLSGVGRALERYQTELGVLLPGVPLCDVNGTLVLCKV